MNINQLCDVYRIYNRLMLWASTANVKHASYAQANPIKLFIVRIWF